MKKIPLFKTYIFLLLIFTSCSSDSGDYSDDTLNNNSDNGDIVLTWETGRTYTTDIKVGETITWVWGSGRHNLVSISGPETFDSGYSSDNGFRFSHKFTQVGTTEYVCEPHRSNQYGTVNVTE